jgi:uncharacterized lipoprotein YmbA
MQTNQSPHARSSGIPRHLSVLLLGMIAAVTLSGCAFLQSRADPTRFYVLTVPHAISAGVTAGDVERWRLGFRLAEAPAYLQTKFMVVRTGTNEIHFAEFDRWAEPLDAGISRVLKETLGSASNVTSVTANSHGEDTLDYEMRVRVLACEGVRAENGTGSIRFTMAWETWSLGTNSMLIKHGAFTANPGAWDGKDYGALAAALSEAISEGGKMLAADLPMEPAFAKKTKNETSQP